jgi:hypothetical protein
MFKTEKIEKLIECALISGFVKDDVPLSIMLIAPPETAKTSILLGFDCYKTYETMDLSPKGIRDYIIPKLNSNEIHHIILPDLVKTISHKATTVMATISFLNALVEEGVKHDIFFGQEFTLDKRVTCGLITSVTNDFFFKVFKKWNDIGFVTRFLPISYDYSPETIREIHKLIQENVFFKDKKEIKKEHLKESYNITIPKDVSSWISLKAQELAKKEGTLKLQIRTQGGKIQFIKPNIKGFRLQRQLRQIARSLALIRDCQQPAVTWEDIETMGDLLEYINFPNTKKVI